MSLSYVFYQKSTFNADISKWIVSKVTDMSNSKYFLANYEYLLLSLLFLSLSIHI
jgi:surface protein